MAGNDWDFELYFRKFVAWGTAEELGEILKWGSPADILAILKAVESPEEAARIVAALRSMVRREERIAWVLAAAGAVGRWMVAVAGAILLWQQVFPVFLAWFGK